MGPWAFHCLRVSCRGRGHQFALEMEALAAGCLRVLRGEEKLQDFGDIAMSAIDRIRIYPGVEPYTAPKCYQDK